MASFAVIFNKIWGGLSLAEPIVSKVVGTAVPASIPIFAMIDPLFHIPMNTVIAGEITNPDLPGPQKLADAVASFANQDFITEMSAVAQQSGMKLVWDDLSLKSGLSAQADMNNFFAKVKASIKMIPDGIPTVVKPV